MKYRFLKINKEAVLLPFLLVGVLCISLLTTNSMAQKPDAMKLAKQYTESSRKNMGLMLQYSWKMRVELTLKGETKQPFLYHMRFDKDRKLQMTLLSKPTPNKKLRGLRKRIAMKKIAKAKAWAAKVVDLYKQYMTPSTGTMVDFLEKATFEAMNDGTVKVNANGFLKPKDRVSFWFDDQTRQPRRFKFSSFLEQDAVEGVVEYGKVPFGPTYASRTNLAVPAKKVSAKIENFDFIKQ